MASVGCSTRRLPSAQALSLQRMSIGGLDTSPLRRTVGQLLLGRVSPPPPLSVFCFSCSLIMPEVTMCPSMQNGKKDTIARMPGMSGQAADAVKAYTQVPLDKAPALLGLPKDECPDTWISLPPSRPSLLEKHQGPSMSIGAKSLRTPTCGTIVGKASGRSIE